VRAPELPAGEPDVTRAAHRDPNRRRSRPHGWPNYTAAVSRMGVLAPRRGPCCPRGAPGRYASLYDVHIAPDLGGLKLARARL